MASQITGVSHDRLPNRLFRRRSKKTSKLRAIGLCEGNSPVTGKFPSHRASNAENCSIWWRHHGHAICTVRIVWASSHNDTISFNIFLDTASLLSTKNMAKQRHFLRIFYYVTLYHYQNYLTTFIFCVNSPGPGCRLPLFTAMIIVCHRGDWLDNEKAFMVYENMSGG